MHHTTSTTFHPDLIVSGPIVETEEEFRVSARLKDDVIAELRPAHFHRHDLRTVVVADIPAYSDRQGRYLPVVIEVQIPRFKDPRTGDTVLGRPPSLPAGYKATSRLLAAIDDAWIEPSAGLASRLCLPESTVRQIRMRRLKNKDAAFRPVASDIIGIDEVHVGRMALRLQSHSRKRGLGVITAPEGNRILAITRDTKQESIEQALRGLAQLDRVRFVTIDMTPHYRAAIRAVLPAATIIVDRWHVRKLIVEIVQNVRKRMVKASADRKKLPRQHWLIAKRRGQLSEAEKLLLDEWLAQNPLLREAYWLKESFCEIYANCDDSSDAKAKYDLWLKSFPKAEGAPDSKACRVANEIQVLFQDFKATVEKWKEEIFAWFDAPFDIRTRKRPSQGQAENRNGFIKKVYARSQGMDFETLRLRMVFGSNPLEYLVPKESTVREAALSSDRPRDSDLLDPLAA